MKSIFYYSFILILFISCQDNNSTIDGLWTVDKVSIGDEEVTPVGRWMRFNSDSTQQSGNGWLQHSVGTWNLDQITNKLNITNTNGFEDPNEDFNVEMINDQMEWTRTEDGQEVTVLLSRTKQLPDTPRDNLLGIWDLEKVIEGEDNVTEKYDPNSNRYLFLRWDRIFISENEPDGRRTGVYRVHGHRSEIELTYYGDDCEREYWAVELNDENDILKFSNANTDKIMEYKRVNLFPE